MSSKSADRSGGAAGVEGADDEMAGEGGLKQRLGRFGVANFADQNDFRVLPHERAQAGGEREARRRAEPAIG